jgi:copper/silver efflux system protein
MTPDKPSSRPPQPGERHDGDVAGSPSPSFAESPQGAIERLIAWSAHNRFLVIVVSVIAVLGGVWSLRNAPLDALPDLSDVQVIIATDWDGRSPDLVEDQITYPISTRFITAPRVKAVRAESMYGKSFVYVIFEDGTDLYWARSRVLEYLSGVEARLPEDAMVQIGPDATGVGWVFQYAIVDRTGNNDLAQLRSLQDWTLRYALESVPGVAEVAPIGGFVRQYQVDVDPNALDAYGITMNEIFHAVHDSNKEVGGKTFEVSGKEFYVRGRGYVKSLADLENAHVKVVNGTPVTLKQVARVHFGADMRRGVAELNGEGEAVGGIIIMRHGENALRVIEGVKQRLKELQPSLPTGVEIVTVYDRSDLILRAMATLKDTLTKEMLVVCLVTALMLFHFRSSLVAIITLPCAVLLSFIPMYWMGLTANIMSLGGIAIAIGAMVDAAIVMVENAHKELEHFKDRHGREPTAAERFDVLVHSAQSVGRSLFFALLVITVSFLPIFSLEAQEGRLFKPLAYTKTFAMFFASLLAVTLAPALMTLFIRGRIVPEARNPISVVLIWLYRPFVNLVLHWRKTTVLLAIAAMGATYHPWSKLGSEFMPPLNEGSILYMPTALPGMSVTEAVRILQLQDRQLMEFPEVETVFGKAGQAETATDPAPLSMFETVVTLKPKDQWRPGMTWDKLIAEMNEKVKYPGMANVFWMPIQTRTEMLSTGLRSVLGVKVYGPTREQVETAAIRIEEALKQLPSTRSAFAERISGGSFLDFDIDREQAARYGVSVEEIGNLIESAVGGKNITYTVEGRERYPVQIRYGRDFRGDLESLARIRVPAAGSQTVTLGQLAKLHYRSGPPSIRSENGALVGYVFVDLHTEDIVGYVKAASEVVARDVKLPAGVYYQWAGQFEHLENAKKKLIVVVPLTLAIVFLLLYVNTGSLVETLIVMLAVPFSLIGAFWLLYLLDYQMSVAVWVGLIALAGLDAETGVVMLLYLTQTWERWRKEGRLKTLNDLIEVAKEGAVQRIRPKMMTVGTTLIGLVPILFATGTGADVMKRIAAPMVGGVVTSAVLELLIYPVLFVMWKRWSLPKAGGSIPAPPGSDPQGKPDPGAPPAPKRTLQIVLVFAGLAVAAGGGWFGWQHYARHAVPSSEPGTAGTAILSQTINDLNVRVIHPEGRLRAAENEFFIEFTDPAGLPVDVGIVAFEIDMNMPGMVMHNAAHVEPAGTPGRYRAHLKPDMGGGWQATLKFDGPQGQGRVTVPMEIKR